MMHRKLNFINDVPSLQTLEKSKRRCNKYKKKTYLQKFSLCEIEFSCPVTGPLFYEGFKIAASRFLLLNWQDSQGIETVLTYCWAQIW